MIAEGGAVGHELYGLISQPTLSGSPYRQGQRLLGFSSREMRTLRTLLYRISYLDLVQPSRLNLPR